MSMKSLVNTVLANYAAATSGVAVAQADALSGHS